MKAKLFIKKLISYFDQRGDRRLIKSTFYCNVGLESYHNGDFIIKGDQVVNIGSFCSFGNGVSIITSNHDYNYACLQGTFYKKYFGCDHPGVLQIPPNKERTKGKVTIGNDVWLADNVTILSGVTIGDGACVANNTVVTKDVESYSIVGGIPAKIIGQRYKSDKIKLLCEIQWWNWSVSKIKENRDFFMLNLNSSSISQIKQTLK